MLLLIIGTFTGAYPLMYFAQEFIPLRAAIVLSSGIVLVIVAIRSMTIMSVGLALFGTVIPAAAILALTLVAAIHPRLQGILITAAALAFFIVVMVLIPRLKMNREALGAKLSTLPSPAPAESSAGPAKASSTNNLIRLPSMVQSGAWKRPAKMRCENGSDSYRLGSTSVRCVCGREPKQRFWAGAVCGLWRARLDWRSTPCDAVLLN